MSAARIIVPPLSGRDRRHFASELRKAEQIHERLVREAAAAHAVADRRLAEAHRLDGEAWSARQFIGGPEEPSPSIAEALHGGLDLLEVKCRHCNHTELVDLALVTWPRSQAIHTLRRALYCAKCLKTSARKRRPDLVGLRLRETPEPSSPAVALR